MIKNGRTLRTDAKLILRGIKEFNRILPGQLRLLSANAELTALAPYVAIVLSSKIITELTGARDINKLALYVLLATGMTFLLTAVGTKLKAKIAVGYSLLFRAHELHLNSKSYDIDYAKLEDPDFRALRDQVTGNISSTGAGMASLYWDTEVVVTNLCSVIVACILSGGIFAVNGSESIGVFAVINSGWAALILAALVLLCAAVSAKATAKYFDVSFEVFKNGAKYSRYGRFYLMEYLADNKAAKDVRIFRQKHIIVNESQKRCYTVFFEMLGKEFAASNKYDGVKLGLSALLGGAVYLFVGLKALSGTVEVGKVVMAYGAVTMLIMSLGALSQIITDLRNNNEHLERYFAYIDTPDSTESGAEKIAPTQPVMIKFENVSFRYPGSDDFALKDLTLEFTPGERLAVVGMNGSGKTTMIKLLCRLYEPTEGVITLNGKNITSYRYDDYLRLFAVVFQDFGLLAFPLGQNVAAAAGYDAARVRECLNLAGFGERLSKLEMGDRQPLYHDYDEEGIDLSGGEEQKIAIARAIYKDAPFVILDEPTAALDPVSEYEIYMKFNAIIGEKTAVYISHRLSSCRFCDKIAVFDNGRLVEYGTHEALLRRADGKYTALWNAQAQYYTHTAEV